MKRYPEATHVLEDTQVFKGSFDPGPVFSLGSRRRAKRFRLEFNICLGDKALPRHEGEIVDYVITI
jgi:hypothetical protein